MLYGIHRQLVDIYLYMREHARTATHARDVVEFLILLFDDDMSESKSFWQSHNEHSFILS